MPLAGQIIKAADLDGYASAVNTTQETPVSSTTYIAGTSVCGTSFVAPTSGRVRVDFQGRLTVNTANRALLSVEVREGSVVGSGTVVSAASNNSAVETGQTIGDSVQAATFRDLTGLTPGSTYNVRTMHSVTGGNATIFNRRIMTSPIP